MVTCCTCAFFAASIAPTVRGPRSSAPGVTRYSESTPLKAETRPAASAKSAWTTRTPGRWPNAAFAFSALRAPAVTGSLPPCSSESAFTVAAPMLPVLLRAHGRRGEGGG